MILKRLPRSVRVWLFILGFWGGYLTSAITMLTSNWMGITGFLIWLIIFVASIALWYAISFRYKDTLEEYGLVERKEKRAHLK